jgi:hypothetical protein
MVHFMLRCIPGEELVTETSICGHVVLKKNGETTELVEIGSDWYVFSRNRPSQGS